jgi:hypothetical protein
MTAMPAVECFVAPWLSLRTGAEGSLAILNNSVQPDYGVLAGLTFRFVRAGIDLVFGTEENRAYVQCPGPGEQCFRGSRPVSPEVRLPEVLPP